MKRYLKAAVAAATLAGASLFAAAPAEAARWSATVVPGGVGFSYGTGGYCDSFGCPDEFWDYAISYCPVYYRGRWYSGPVYYRVVGRTYYYWVRGGWHRDEWNDGRRPSFACLNRYGPSLDFDFYLSHGFRWRNDWRDRWFRSHGRGGDRGGWHDRDGNRGDAGGGRPDRGDHDNAGGWNGQQGGSSNNAGGSNTSPPSGGSGGHSGGHRNGGTGGWTGGGNNAAGGSSNPPPPAGGSGGSGGSSGGGGGSGGHQHGGGGSGGSSGGSNNAGAGATPPPANPVIFGPSGSGDGQPGLPGGALPAAPPPPPPPPPAAAPSPPPPPPSDEGTRPANEN